MDPSLLILTLSICFCFLAFSVQSQQNVSPLSPPPRSPPPRQQHHHPPPPPKSPKSVHSAPKTTTSSESKHSNHDKHNYKKHDKYHGKSKKKPNWGKKLGFMFMGVAAILQVCVLGFLLIKRRQLLKAERNI